MGSTTTTRSPLSVHQPGMGPRCFLTGAGFATSPGLLRVQTSALVVDAAQGWYDVELIDFHLRDAEDPGLPSFRR